MFAVCDADALQRACTVHTVQSLGFEVMAFSSIADLFAALDAGLSFAVIGLALHPPHDVVAEAPSSLLRRVPAGCQVVLLAHATEIPALHPLLLRALQRNEAEFIRTPIEDEELLLRLDVSQARRAGVCTLKEHAPC